jgi:hypothetical protein
MNGYATITAILTLSIVSGVTTSTLGHAATTITEQDLLQKDVGSGESTNNNCGTNAIADDSASIECPPEHNPCVRCFEIILSEEELERFAATPESLRGSCDQLAAGINTEELLRAFLASIGVDPGTVNTLIECLRAAGAIGSPPL